MQNSETEKRQKLIKAKLTNLDMSSEEKFQLAAEIDILANILIEMYRRKRTTP